MLTVMFLLVVAAFGLGFVWHDQSAKETVVMTNDEVRMTKE